MILREMEDKSFSGLSREALDAAIKELVAARDVNRLQELAAERAAPDVARAAARGLHALRSRGITVPEATGRTVQFKPAEEPLPPALIGLNFVYDVQWVLFFRPDQAGDPNVVSALIGGDGALVNLDAARTTRSGYRSVAAEMTSRDRSTLEIDADAAFARVAAAVAARQAELGAVALVPGAEIIQSMPPVRAGDLKPVAAVSAAGPVARDDFMKVAGRDEFRAWVPDEPTLRTFAEAVRGAATSLVAIDERQIAGQIDGVVKATVATYFTPARCATHATRLRDLGALYDHRTLPDAAGVARALASELGASAFDAANHPYCAWFFGRFVPALTRNPPGSPKDAEPTPATPSGRIILT